MSNRSNKSGKSNTSLPYGTKVRVRTPTELRDLHGTNKLGEPLLPHILSISTLNKFSGRELTVKYDDPRGYVIFEGDLEREFTKYCWCSETLEVIDEKGYSSSS